MKKIIKVEKIEKRLPDESDRVAEVGDETGDWSSPRPDENVADEIGEEVGLRFEDEEPLRPIEKVAARDRHRAELDPASDPDYVDRQEALDED
jgi:hypothetical protein